MNCPLQNMRLQECLNQENTLNKNDVRTEEHQSELSSETPTFSRYEHPQKDNISFQTKVQESSSQRSSPFSEKNDALLKYLQHSFIGAELSVQKQEDENNYSFELGELKQKIMQIEQISQAQIIRLKQQLQEERKMKEQSKKAAISIGVNTQQDPKDDEIAILKEMLKQQCLLNKQLLKESLKIKEQFGQIRLTKN